MSFERILKHTVEAAVRDELHAAGLSSPEPWPVAVSIADAAKMLSVGVDTVRQLIAEGRLRTMDFGPNRTRKVIPVISLLELDPGFDVGRHFRLVDTTLDDLAEFDDSPRPTPRRRAS